MKLHLTGYFEPLTLRYAEVHILQGCIHCGGKMEKAGHGYGEAMRSCAWCERLRLGRMIALLRQAEYRFINYYLGESNANTKEAGQVDRSSEAPE